MSAPRRTHPPDHPAWANLDEPGPHFRPTGETGEVALPLRLHAQAAEELVERLPPLVEPPRFDARHVRVAEPGAYLTVTLLAEVHGVPAPALPVPADALLPPQRVEDPLSAVTLFEALGGAAFAGRAVALGWGAADARGLAAVVRELARNALEHGGLPLWVAGWKTAPGELRIAVADSGPGFAGSLCLADERFAMREALMHGRSRSGGAGRGQGLRRVADQLGRWRGRMRVRSRTVALEGTPPWNDLSVQAHLPFLAGVQVEVTLPCPLGRGSLTPR